MPSAVLFDLYNTLVDGGDGQAGPVLDAMATDLGVDPELFGRRWRESWPARCVGAFGDAESTVRTVAAQAGGRPGEAAIRLASARRLAFQRQLLWPRAATLATIDALRASGWRTAIVSNCTHDTVTLWKTTPLGPRFDATAFSVELGIAKPDPRIYLAACAALRVPPPQCLYVGDGADDELPAAAALGMTVVLTEEFKATTASWPRQRIQSLSELAPGRLSVNG